MHTYHVAFSAKQNSWYISDETGECCSSLYDTQDEAHSALIRGEF